MSKCTKRILICVLVSLSRLFQLVGRINRFSHAYSGFYNLGTKVRFKTGFLIVLPFLVNDLVVATLTISTGMTILPPTVISFSFKILFFVFIYE